MCQTMLQRLFQDLKYNTMIALGRYFADIFSLAEECFLVSDMSQFFIDNHK